jgi:hypothetical protein
MKKHTHLYFFAAVVLYLASCTTVKVAKAPPESNAKGVRYSLGKPFIKVTPDPKGDGTYSVELIYLPDNDQTYAVDAKSFFTKFTMELNVDENGILQKVDWTKGGDSFASDILGASAELAKADIDRKAAERKAAEEEFKVKEKAAKDELKTLNTTLAQKELDSLAANEDLISLLAIEKPGEDVPEKIRQARILIKKLEAELKTLRKSIADSQETVDELLSAKNIPEQTTAYGPVLFEIKDYLDKTTNKEKVELVAVDWGDGVKQKIFETVPEVEGSDVIESDKLDFELSFKAIPIEKIFSLKVKEATINETLSTIKSEKGSTIEIKKISPKIKDDHLSLTFSKADFTEEKYFVKIFIKYKSGNEEKEEPVTLNVTIKK